VSAQAKACGYKKAAFKAKGYLMRPKPWLTLADGSPLTRQESFVLKQVAAGDIADLKKEFGEVEEDRRLRARFLEELLTGELKGVVIHRRGRRIRNAVFEESIDLQNVQVSDSVELDTCIFKESVSFRDACLECLDLSGSHFFKAADFHRIKVVSTFFCRNTIFEGVVNIASASIDGQFAAEGAKFLAKTDEVIFNSLKVGKHAFFDGAEFHGPIDCGSAEIRGQLTAEDAKFFSDNYIANFNAIHCNYASFKRAEFHGPVDFVAAEIKGQFVALGAKFLAPKHKISFIRMQVGQDAFFKGCDFHGLVSFVQIKIAGDLHLEALQQTGPERATIFRNSVNLRGAEIGGELLTDKAQFLGHIANFEAVKVGRSFHASGAIFGGSVKFIEMQVRNNFYLNPFGKVKPFKTLFKGPADFSRLEVGGVFNANQAIFKSESVIFSGLKVGLTAFFNGTIFFAGLVLKEGQLTDLVVRGLHKLSSGGLAMEEIVLNRTRVAHRLTIQDIEVKKFDARNLEVKGPAELRRLVIKGEADLRDAACHHLQMVEIDWPEPRGGKKKVLLDGLTYESITTETEPDKQEDWDKVFNWLSLSRFNTRNYGQLEDYLQRGGNKPRADKAFIRGKRRSWRRRRWWSPGKWGILLFWDWLGGYGRKPGRIIWVSLAIILIGAFTFEPEFQGGSNWLAQYYAPHPWLGRFFLSVDRFLPSIDLGWSRVWMPGNQSFFAVLWWQVQQICGWILIPIGLAAVYTRLK
jgi:hypothetical protein